MATVIDELVARLAYEVDSSGLDEWQRGTDAAAESTEDLGEAAEDAGEATDGFSSKLAGGITAVAAIGAAAVVAAGAIAVKLVTSFAEAGDEIAKTSKQIGIASDDLQELRFAAQQSGVSNAALEKSLKLMQVGLFDAQTKGVGPFQEGLDALGISVDDLDTLSTREQLGLFADELNKVDNEQKKTAISAKLLGARAGVEMKTLLAEGSVGLNALAGEARDLDGVLSGESLKSAEELTDAFGRMSTLATGLGNRIGAKLAPIVTDAVGRFTAWIQENDEFIEQDIPAMIDLIIEALEVVVPWVIDLAKETKSLVVQFRDFRAEGSGLEAEIKVLSAAWSGFVRAVEISLIPLTATVDLIVGLAEAVGVLDEEIGRTTKREGIKPGEGVATDEAGARGRAGGTAGSIDENVKRSAKEREAQGKKRAGSLNSGTAPSELRAVMTGRGTIVEKKKAASLLPSAMKREQETLNAFFAAGGQQGVLSAFDRGGGGGGAASRGGAARGGRGGKRSEPTLDELLGIEGAAGGSAVPAAGGGASPTAGASITRIDASFNAPTEINVTIDASEAAGLNMDELGDMVAGKIEEAVSVTNRRAYDHYQQAVRP